MPGKVYLVGAGPGDPRLLTVGAAAALKKADTVVYDRLADERILDHAPAGAERIYVGKAAAHHAMTQSAINELLVKKAEAGKKVVRLKGGDPFIFGRGGEEALRLREAKIPFEVIPGVTSAAAVPAYAGIPVTQRGMAASFAVITGHEDPTKTASAVKWDKLATGADTLVFLMGVENLPHITSELIKNGRPEDTPAALIRWGTKPEQEVWITTVAEAAALAEKQKITPPAIFIVGEVVKLRDKLNWYDNRPLSGKTFLVTRAKHQASQLTARLEALGARCLEVPTIKLLPPTDNYAALDRAIGEIHRYKWLIFTSVNGVKHFFERLNLMGRDSRSLSGASLAAIGVPTAEELGAYGLRADLVPENFRAEGLIEALREKIAGGDNILIPRAEAAREILPEELTKLGAAVAVVPAYKTEAALENGELLRERLTAGAIDCITFTSSSTVTNLLKLVDKDLLTSAKIACIGPVTADTAVKSGLKVDLVAEQYTISGLVEAILRHG